MPDPARKTSFHLLHHPSFGQIIPLIKQVRPTVIKALSAGDYLPRLADALRNELDYEPLYIQRVWFEGRGAGHPNFYENYSYDQWRGACIVELNTCAGRGNFLVESYNETGLSPEYFEFETERTHRLKAEFSIRSAVLNLGVGWSTPQHVNMAISAGLLDALRDEDGAWCEHGYMMCIGSQAWRGHNQPDLPDGRYSKALIDIANDRTIYPPSVIDWLTLRITMTHEAMLARGYNVPCVLTEYGFDDAGKPTYKNYTGGQDVGPWKQARDFWSQWGYLNSKTPARFYGEQLALGEAQMQAPGWDWLLGACVFTTGSDPGSDRWPLFDILDEDGTGSEVLDEFMIALPEFIPQEPPPEPEPPARPTLPVTGCWVAAWPYNVHIRQEPDATSDSIGIIHIGEMKQSLGTVQQASDPGRTWHKLANGGYSADWVLINNGGCEPIKEDNGETNVTESNFGLVYWEPQGAEAASVINLGAPYTVFGNERSAAAVAKDAQTDCVLRFWFDDGPRNPGNWMTQMRGQPTSEAVKAWFEAAPVDQYVNTFRKQTINHDVHGTPYIDDNPDYNPYGVMWLLDGDGVETEDLPAFFGFSAEVLRQLEARTVIIGQSFHLQFGLRGAVVNRDISDDDQELFWNMAHARGLLDAIVNTGSYLRLKVKINGLFKDRKRSDVFPLEAYQHLSRLGYLAQMRGRIILQCEYIGGWHEQGHSEDDVVADLALLAQTARQDVNIAAVNVFLRTDNPTDSWVPSHDIGATIEQRITDIVNGVAPSPDVDWQSEDDPTPEPPQAVIEGPTSAKVGEECFFTNASTGDISNWYWSISDGSSMEVASMTYVFNAPGTYEVNLTVTGPGGSDLATHTITITPADEPPSPEPTPTPFKLPNLPDWIPFMIGTITGAAIVIIAQAV